MAEQSEIFVPAPAALAIVEARLAAGWSLLAVSGFRVKRGDTSPEQALGLDFGPEGTTDIESVGSALAAWPVDADLFAEIRFAPR